MSVRHSNAIINKNISYFQYLHRNIEIFPQNLNFCVSVPSSRALPCRQREPRSLRTGRSGRTPTAGPTTSTTSLGPPSGRCPRPGGLFSYVLEKHNASKKNLSLFFALFFFLLLYLDIVYLCCIVQIYRITQWQVPEAW